MAGQTMRCFGGGKSPSASLDSRLAATMMVGVADPLLYLLHVGSPGATGRLAFPGDAFALGDGLYLVRCVLSRSRLYHQIKRQLHAQTPLLVAPLADDPKFKGMRPGALKWIRSAAG